MKKLTLAILAILILALVLSFVKTKKEIITPSTIATSTVQTATSTIVYPCYEGGSCG